MDNATALQRFEQSLRRCFPDGSTPVHYVSHVRKFQRVCSKPWAEVTVPVTTIQCLLGHHDLRTTQRYAHVMEKKPPSSNITPPHLHLRCVQARCKYGRSWRARLRQVGPSMGLPPRFC